MSVWWTPEIDARIRSLRNSGKGWADIARVLHKSVLKVREHAKHDLGLPSFTTKYEYNRPNKIDWTDEMNATVIQGRAQGLSWTAIGKALSISPDCVRLHGRCLDIPSNKTRVPVVKAIEEEDDQLPFNDRPPLPAGHPISWGAISSEPFSRFDAQ